MYIKMKGFQMTMAGVPPLRIAFIGGAVSSAVGYTHFNASRMDGNFVVEAGCFSRNPAENQRSGTVYGIPESRLYENWTKLLECEKNRLDAIFVLTPIPSHAEIVISALQHGYPVVCEKALGISSEECRQINSAVSENNGYLAVTLNYSGYPMVRQLRQMVAEGRLGHIQQIVIEMPQESFLRSGANPQEWRRHDYGVPTVSLDLGVHVHHLVSFITSGKRPLRVVGDQCSLGQFRGLIDNMYCIAHYEDDLRVQMWWGKTALGHRNGLRIRVYGSEASAEWYQMNPEFLHWADNDGHYFVLDRASGEAKVAQELRYNRFKAGHPSGFIEAFANLYADIADDLRSFKRGERKINPFVFGADHSREGLELMESIHHASKESRWIYLQRTQNA